MIPIKCIIYAYLLYMWSNTATASCIVHENANTRAAFLYFFFTWTHQYSKTLWRALEGSITESLRQPSAPGNSTPLQWQRSNRVICVVFTTCQLLTVNIYHILLLKAFSKQSLLSSRCLVLLGPSFDQQHPLLVAVFHKCLNWGYWGCSCWFTSIKTLFSACSRVQVNTRPKDR